MHAWKGVYFQPPFFISWQITKGIFTYCFWSTSCHCFKECNCQRSIRLQFFPPSLCEVFVFLHYSAAPSRLLLLLLLPLPRRHNVICASPSAQCHQGAVCRALFVVHALPSTPTRTWHATHPPTACWCWDIAKHEHFNPPKLYLHVCRLPWKTKNALLQHTSPTGVEPMTILTWGRGPLVLFWTNTYEYNSMKSWVPLYALSQGSKCSIENLFTWNNPTGCEFVWVNETSSYSWSFRERYCPCSSEARNIPCAEQNVREAWAPCLAAQGIKKKLGPCGFKILATYWTLLHVLPCI